MIDANNNTKDTSKTSVAEHVPSGFFSFFDTFI